MGEGIRLLAVIVCAALSGLLSSAAAPESSSAGQSDAPQLNAQLLAYAQDGSAILVRPLDDPANPYAAEYGSLEHWVAQNSEPLEAMRERAAVYMQQQKSQPGSNMLVYDESEFTIRLRVDDAGWLAPYAKRNPNQLDQARPGRSISEIMLERGSDYLPQKQRHYFIYANPAELTPELTSEIQRQQELSRIEGKPLIPRWLGENPPLSARFMPNGDVLCYGELGLAYEIDHKSPLAQIHHEYGPAGETWYRYSSDGKLLGKLPNSRNLSNDWMMLYWPEMLEAIDAERSDRRRMVPFSGGLWLALCSGTVARFDFTGEAAPEPTVVHAAWSYDGRPLDPRLPLPTELEAASYLQQRRDVLQLFQLQQKYGLTDPNSLSPYAGQPDGPQLTDPTPREWPRIVRHQYGEASDRDRSVRLLRLDDPANPYFGQYGEWERLAWTQYGKPDPSYPPVGRPILSTPEPIPVNFFDDWREIWLYADDAGALYPLAEQGRLEAEHKLSFDHRNPRGDGRRRPGYVYNTGAELSETQWAAFNAERLRHVLPLYPQVPDWLPSQPASYIVFVPNGDVIALYTPLGGYDDSPAALKHAERYLSPHNRTAYIYSPDGILHSTQPLGNYGWMEAYFAPELRARLDAYAAEGRYIRAANGFTLVYAGPLYTLDSDGQSNRLVDPTPALVAAFDWDGTELDSSAPLLRDDFHCRNLEWHSVRELAAVRSLLAAAQAGGGL